MHYNLTNLLFAGLIALDGCKNDDLLPAEEIIHEDPNEGEPSGDYTNDPAGSVSIISIEENYAAATLDFAAFSGQQEALEKGGFRVFGLSGDFAKDVEPLPKPSRISFPYVFTVNEGDAREYDAFEEAERIKDVDLDKAKQRHTEKYNLQHCLYSTF